MVAKQAGRMALDRLALLSEPIYGQIGIDIGVAESLASRTLENRLRHL